jgi:hypothetical protein
MASGTTTAMSETVLTLVLVVIVSGLTGVLTFGLIYVFWLRTVLRKLQDVQLLLTRILGALQSGNPPASGSALTTPQENKAPLPKMQMSVEGKAVAILEINGRNVVRFEENLSSQEKRRIIDYLKVEGFLPPTRGE